MARVDPTIIEWREDPIHEWFELSYAAYLVLPRSALQSMPFEWQEAMVARLRELDKAVVDAGIEFPQYTVAARDEAGRMLTDDLRDYQRGRRKLW